MSRAWRRVAGLVALFSSTPVPRRLRVVVSRGRWCIVIPWAPSNTTFTSDGRLIPPVRRAWRGCGLRSRCWCRFPPAGVRAASPSGTRTRRRSRCSRCRSRVTTRCRSIHGTWSGCRDIGAGRWRLITGATTSGPIICVRLSSPIICPSICGSLRAPGIPTVSRSF